MTDTMTMAPNHDPQHQAWTWTPCGRCWGQSRIHAAGQWHPCAWCLAVGQRLEGAAAQLARNDDPAEATA